ncbi:MAG TPA: hypothetical protein VGC93_13855 [Thermoanaerobaculia bacterium]|jgi:hypothetical protein
MKKILTLSVLLLCAGPAAGQTFLQQVFAASDRDFFLDVTEDAQVAFTVMWNRQTATLIAVMVCEAGGDAFEYAASAPDQERTLRMDVGVFAGLFCLISVSTDLTAAFAINFQSFAEGNLEKAGGSPVLIRDAGEVEPEKAERLRARLKEVTARLRGAVGPRPAAR